MKCSIWIQTIYRRGNIIRKDDGWWWFFPRIEEDKSYVDIIRCGPYKERRSAYRGLERYIKRLENRKKRWEK